MSHENLKKNTIIGLIWKFSENFGTQLISFVVQLVLARILLPEDYGIIAVTAVFIMIAQVFIQTGFSSVLIQKKEINDLETSTIFHAGFMTSIVIFGIIFFIAPWIESFYNIESLALILRIQSVTIILSGLSSVQNALLVRHLAFKKTFIYRLLAVTVQGVVGIYMALNGFGIWAIVISNLVNTSLVTLSFWLIVKWKPKLIFSYKVFKELFLYSSRILMFNLVNTIYNNIQALVIGKAFSTETLGYYNRGYQVPMLIMVNTDGAIHSVMFSSLSKVQDDREKFLAIYRSTIKSSVFIVFPMMIGLIAVAEPLTLFLLTDKWLGSVPFLQLTALICMTWPFSIIYQALNAENQAKLSFRLNALSKGIALILLFISLPFGVYAFVFSAFISAIITLCINAFVLKKTYLYQLRTQFLDALGALIASFGMGLVVYSVGFLIDHLIILLLVQGITGISIYLLLSFVFNRETVKYLYFSIIDLIKPKKII